MKNFIINLISPAGFNKKELRDYRIGALLSIATLLFLILSLNIFA